MRKRLNDPKVQKRPAPCDYAPLAKSKSEPGISYSIPALSATASSKKEDKEPGPGAYNWVDPDGFGRGPKSTFRRAAKTEIKPSKTPGPGEHKAHISTLGSHPCFKVGASCSFTDRWKPQKPPKTCPDFPPLASTFA